MTRLSQTMIALLALTACSEEKTQVVKDKTYYLAHRDELAAENRRCREATVAASDSCIRIGTIQIEIDREEVGARIKAR
jgi:hypothetical protein